MTAASGVRAPVIYHPRSAVFWVYVAAVALGSTVLLAQEGAAIRETLAANLRLSPLWVGFVAFMVWLMLRFDPFRAMRPYPQALVAGMTIGATTAVSMSILGNTALGSLWSLVLPRDVLARWQSALTAPLIEESAKALCAAVVLALGAGLFTRISHALLIGMFTGFGFDLSEDLGYATRNAITNLDSDVAGAGQQLALRIFTAMPSHWSYTSLTVVGLFILTPWFARNLDWSPGRRVAIGAGLLMFGPLLHFMWNSPLPDAELAGLLLLVKLILGLAIYLAIIFWLLRHERKWVVSRVDDGRRLGWLADIDRRILSSLPTRNSRRALQRSARRSGGRPAADSVAVGQRNALDRIQTYGVL